MSKEKSDFNDQGKIYDTKLANTVQTTDRLIADQVRKRNNWIPCCGATAINAKKAIRSMEARTRNIG